MHADNVMRHTDGDYYVGQSLLVDAGFPDEYVPRVLRFLHRSAGLPPAWGIIGQQKTPQSPTGNQPIEAAASGVQPGVLGSLQLAVRDAYRIAACRRGGKRHLAEVVDPVVQHYAHLEMLLPGVVKHPGVPGQQAQIIGNRWQRFRRSRSKKHAPALPPVDPCDFIAGHLIEHFLDLHIHG